MNKIGLCVKPSWESVYIPHLKVCVIFSWWFVSYPHLTICVVFTCWSVNDSHLIPVCGPPVECLSFIPSWESVWSPFDCLCDPYVIVCVILMLWSVWSSCYGLCDPHLMFCVNPIWGCFCDAQLRVWTSSTVEERYLYTWLKSATFWSHHRFRVSKRLTVSICLQTCWILIQLWAVVLEKETVPYLPLISR